jgi:hypothetical protein
MKQQCQPFREKQRDWSDGDVTRWFIPNDDSSDNANGA